MAKGQTWNNPAPVLVPVYEKGQKVSEKWIYQGDRITEKQLEYAEKILGVKNKDKESTEAKGG